MPGKSRKAKRQMYQKRREQLQRASAAAPAPAAPPLSSAPAAPAPRPAGPATPRPAVKAAPIRNPYVLQELARIALLSAGIIVLLFVLAAIFRA